jgi:DNA-binding beta-propeller fold protein YncE
MLCAAVAALDARAGRTRLPLETVARVSLPGAAVRFDYTSLDPARNQLWIAHMDADELLAFDVRTRKVTRRIPAPGVHGVIAVPQLGRVFASATNDHEVLTIQARTGAVLAKAPAGAYPDGLAYDPVERHVFVSDESGGVETVVDRRGHRVATISVGGEAGNVQYDAGSRRILVAVQSRGDLALIDPRANRVVRRVALAGCESPHGLLVDSSRRLAFVACAGNARLLTLDLRTMRVSGSAGVGDSPDVLAFDSSLRRLYVSAESGVVAVFAEHVRSLTKLGQALLAPNAHTVAVDPRTHRVYFPLQSGSRGGPQLLIMKPA